LPVLFVVLILEHLTGYRDRGYRLPERCGKPYGPGKNDQKGILLAGKKIIRRIEKCFSITICNDSNPLMLRG
jgi:hypothetical protein